MRPTLAKGHSVSDSTSWAYALLVVLLASPVLAAVVVLVTTVGQTGSNRVPVQASGSGGQAVAQEVRPVIVMPRVSRGSARRPGSAVDPVGRQVSSPATFHERFDRFTSRRREQTRGRRADPHAGDPDQVPYPSSSWPAVAPPLIETPGVTSPEANASGGLGREMSPVRSWGWWVRALAWFTVPPRHVRPPVGGRQAPVREIVAEPPEIPARVAGGYMLPPVRVRARLGGTEGSTRAPLILTGIAELEAGANTSRHDGDGQLSSSLVVASNDGEGFELALVATAVDQTSPVQLSFLVAEAESREGYVIAKASRDGPTQVSPLPNVVASIETDLPEAVVSPDLGTKQDQEGPDLVHAVPLEAVTAVLVTDGEPLEHGLGSIGTPISVAKPETSIDVFEEAAVAAGEPHEMEMAVEITAPVVAIEPVITFVAEALVTDAELLDVDHVYSMPVAEMPIRSVMTEVASGQVVEVELVDVAVDVDVAGLVPRMAIDQIMADATGVLVAETGLASVEPVYTQSEPVMDIQPASAYVPEVDVAEAVLASVEPVYTLSEPVMDIQPASADVPEVDVAETGLVDVQPGTAMSGPEMAIEPASAAVPDVDVAEAVLVDVQPGTAMSGPEMAIEPVIADVPEVDVAEAVLASVEPVYTLSEPVMGIQPASANVPEVDVAETGLVEVQLGTAMSGPEMAIELVIADVVEGSASGPGTGDDPESVGFEDLRVSDAWAAMTQVETVEMVTPSEAGLELEPFVDVPITAFAYEVDGNETDALVSSEDDKRPKLSVPSAQSGAELSLLAMELLDSGRGATDETDLAVNGLELGEDVAPGCQEATFTPAPALPVEQPQPAWMPLPRSAKFRWVRTTMLATGVGVPHGFFKEP